MSKTCEGFSIVSCIAHCVCKMCCVNCPLRCCHFRIGHSLDGGRRVVELFKPRHRSAQAALCPLARTICVVRLWRGEVSRGGRNMAPIDEGRSFVQERTPS